MTRRDFALRLATLGTVTTLPACFLSGGVYRNLEHYIPTALLAFDRIIEMLVENGIDVSHLADPINRVKARLADIQSAILAWKDGHSGDKPTLAEVVRAALRLAGKALDDFWARLNLPPDLAPTVRTLLDIISSTLNGFGLAAGSSPAARTVLTAPRVRTIREFREDFNHVLEQHGESKFAI